MNELPEGSIELTVDGVRHCVEVEPDRFLSDVLRTELGLTSVKEACTEGECGSCTVLVGGQALDSCIFPVGLVTDRPIETAGRTGDATFSGVRQALVDAGAIQCGFCTPGIVTAAVALLRESPHPSRDEVKEALVGNLCRCTGYGPIVDAIAGHAAGGRHVQD